MNDFDPLKPETFDSPYEDYRRLRQECPVAHSDAWGGFWALTRHADVSAAAGDSKMFVTSVQNVVPRVAFTGRRPPLHLDPPEHTPYRQALTPLLAEKRVARFEPIIRDICNKLLDDMVAKGGGDICLDYSSAMPILTFAHWMNLSEDQIAELSDVGRRYNYAVQANDIDATKETSAYLYQMARDILEDRKANPQDPAVDPTAALLAATTRAGEPLPDEMIVGTIRQVLVVGIIAPTVLIGSIAIHLSNDRDLQQKLRENADLIPSAVEEFLRLYTPYRGFARTPVEDVCLHGRTIRKDEPVALVYASANRDESVFEDAETFRLDRDNMKESVAFGRGPHMCVGAPLARLELVVALECLLARTRGFRISGPVKPTRMPEIGALSVPLAFE